jgi:hypothetical protein
MSRGCLIFFIQRILLPVIFADADVQVTGVDAIIKPVVELLTLCRLPGIWADNNSLSIAAKSMTMIIKKLM